MKKYIVCFLLVVASSLALAAQAEGQALSTLRIGDLPPSRAREYVPSGLPRPAPPIPKTGGKAPTPAELDRIAREHNLPPAAVPIKLEADRYAHQITVDGPTEETVFAAVSRYEAIGWFAECRRLLELLLSRRHSWRATLLMGWEYLQEGRPHEALPWYDRAIKQDPAMLDGYHGKMLALIKIGETQRAVEVGCQILQRDPTNVTAALRIGDLCYAAKNYASALNYYAIAPDHVDCRLGMGLTLWKLHDFDRARPHLLAALRTYPQHAELRVALKQLNEAELHALQLQLATPGDILDRPGKQARVATLLELNGHALRAAEWLRKLLPANPNFAQLLRIADNYTAAGEHDEAGEFYQLAARKSPDPRTTKLAAVDAFVAAGNLQRAELLLTDLRAESPGPEVDQRSGALFARRKLVGVSWRHYQQAGEGYENQAKSAQAPRDLLLLAIDAYQNARNHNDARRLLERMALPGVEFAVDQRWSRLFFDTCQYPKAIEIYDRYPGSLDMQIAKGWSLVHLHRRQDARDTFKAVLAKHPEHAGARAGLDAVDAMMQSDVFLIVTGMDYGSYQDGRYLTTGVVRYVDRRAVTTISHTSTDVPTVSQGKPDFKEDLIGLRCYYSLNDQHALQFHLMHFENDDVVTDGGNVFGMKYWYFPTPRWTLSAEGDYSSYTHIHTNQFTVGAGYRINPYWHVDLAGSFIHAAGSGWAPSDPRNTGGARLTVGYTPNRRWYFGAVGLFGKRIMAVDAEGLYAFNNQDVYKTGFSLLSTCRLTPFVKLYVHYNETDFTSAWQEAENTRLGFRFFDSAQRARTYSLGVDTFW